MKLSALLEQLPYTLLQGSLDTEVSGIVYDSRKVTKGCLFVCMQGLHFDSHTHAGWAADSGAGVIVTQKDIKLPKDSTVTVLKVEDTRYALACLSAAWFGYPASRMKIIGITGTKGKTTTAYLVRSILQHAGHRVGLIGTIEVIIGEEHFKAGNTTPESYLIQQYFKRMADAGCDTVVMEVSSQGLMLHRCAGFVFDYGIFTNISPDHIGKGEHEDFAQYLACKSMLFKQCRIGILNGDDPHLEEILKEHTCMVETFGLNENCDLQAYDSALMRDGGCLGVAFKVRGLLELDAKIATPGRFSIYNALTAIAICRHFGVEKTVIQSALSDVKVKGRIEPVPVPYDFTVLIDYAHNAMSLESLLTSLREYEPHRLICLFGCGGNRSRVRRFEMGEVSGRLADLTIITSDNPRFEEPQDIIADIRSGILPTKGRFEEICDRREAIAYAISIGEPGDILVLAGKGHEDYQEIRGIKYPMDERNVVAEAVRGYERIREAGEETEWKDAMRMSS